MTTPDQDADKSRSEILLQQILQQITAGNHYQRYLAMGPDKVHSFMYADRLFHVHLPFADKDLIQRKILLSSSFFELPYLERIRKIMPGGAIVIDAGANIGNHTLFFAGVCRAKRVYSFEPQRQIFRILETNIRLNDFDQVMPINAVLGAAAGRANMETFTARNIGATSFQAATEGDYEITSIDALDLDKVDFIKMDVEGAQQPALEGARQTLARCRPLLWIELRRKLGEYEPTAALLQSMGYRQERCLGPDDFLFAPCPETAAVKAP